MTLNERAWRLVDHIEAEARNLRVAVHHIAGARVIDCGAQVPGGLEAGRLLAQVCLADLAEVSFVPSPEAELPGPFVQVRTDDPVRACLASQYAGWQVKGESFFAMGSGPMRAAAAREELFRHLPGAEQPPCAVGVLETKQMPTPDILAGLIGKLPASVERIALLYAPAASLAGTIQVVARSVETALHKLHEIKFDVTQIVSAFGVAPLPPVARNELEAIGLTNDAILYGARVTLWVRSDDAVIETLGPQIPSCSSKDYGASFAELFQRYGDFYKIDPMLFSPAEVTIHNLTSGRTRTFGRVDPKLLNHSWRPK